MRLQAEVLLYLQAEGVLCYGPSAAAARIEADKSWAKGFMSRHGIPTADGRAFEDYAAACEYIDSLPTGKVWVKASGLAAGKGAVGCDTREEALASVKEMLVGHQFGASSETVVIERDMPGWETSCHAFCDGKTAKLWPFSTDYKRSLDGGEGLNTGGMGAYSPSAGVSEDLIADIRRLVVDPVIAGMAAEGHPYNGTSSGSWHRRGADRRYTPAKGDPEPRFCPSRSDLTSLSRCRVGSSIR